MDKQNRKAIIAGNWKMNKTATEAAELIDALIPAVKDAGCEVVICVPFTDLVTAVAKTKGTNIHVGAENVHFEKSGAFTGEISADMLTDLGVEYVVVGHSERRQYFAETDETVNKRAKAALAGGLKPIICVGESLTQREQGVTEELIRMQVKIALNGVTADELKNVVIAYEPIWAIGTGKTATADHGNAEKMKNPDGTPFTAHTTNPVPFVAIGCGDVKLREGGCLADIAPTMLPYIGLPVPSEMTGKSLIVD